MSADPSVSPADTRCPETSQEGARCIYEVGHDGSHFAKDSFSYYSWERAAASPADTVRLQAAAEAALPFQVDGGWYEPESEALDALGKPGAEFVAAATPQLILALLAVGERDGRQIAALRRLIEGLLYGPVGHDTALLVEDAVAALKETEDVHDPLRRQIAQLTEALDGLIAAETTLQGTTAYTRLPRKRQSALEAARAVLADKEDAE